jgi:hypothetical protein
MNVDDDAEKIRRRMAELRRELESDVREVGRSARVMTDWTFYVRKFPWAVTAVALAAGYMLIPKKKEIIKPDPEMLAELVKKKKLRVEPVARAQEKRGLLGSLLVMGITWAARTGVSYVTQQLSDAAFNKAQPPRQPDRQPAPSPVHEPWNS